MLACIRTDNKESKTSILVSVDDMNRAVNARDAHQRSMVHVVSKLHCKESTVRPHQQQLRSQQCSVLSISQQMIL